MRESAEAVYVTLAAGRRVSATLIQESATGKGPSLPLHEETDRIVQPLTFFTFFSF
jgi:hypothetical protein